MNKFINYFDVIEKIKFSITSNIYMILLSEMRL